MLFEHLNIPFEFDSSDKDSLIVFLPSVRPYSLLTTYPYLPRIAWRKRLANTFDTLYIADPYQRDEAYKTFGGSWFISQKGESILPEIASALIALIKEKSYKHIIFYGSSMGGYAALVLGALVEGSVVVAECPQVFLEEYYASGQVLSAFCNESSKALIPDPVKLILDNDGKSEFHFVVNLHDRHVKKHILPLVEIITTDEAYENARINVLLYTLKGYSKGHTALEYEEAIKVIKEVLKFS